MTYSSSLGFSPSAVFYADPPTVDDGGLRVLDPLGKDAFLWSIKLTTSSDPTEGNNSEIIAGYADTYSMPVIAGPADGWLDAYLGDGYAVLYLAPAVEDLSDKLSFFVTKDPRYIAENASAAFELMVVVDGPEPLLQAARSFITGDDQPGTTTGACPPGTLDLFGTCVPVPDLPSLPWVPPSPPGLPSTPPVVPPTLPATPPVVPPPGLPSTPPATTPPGAQPPAQPGSELVAKAATDTPEWLAPALVAVGAISVFVLVAKAVNKKG